MEEVFIQHSEVSLTNLIKSMFSKGIGLICQKAGLAVAFNY